mmetsp:Transcript_18864/g.37103  ORF Transcript_18864/g.37103 Transcript_18864/m.37103 type:complete len:334 (-) Transcript_18864:232-1233(-)
MEKNMVIGVIILGMVLYSVIFSAVSLIVGDGMIRDQQHQDKVEQLAYFVKLHKLDRKQAADLVSRIRMPPPGEAIDDVLESLPTTTRAEVAKYLRFSVVAHSRFSKISGANRRSVLSEVSSLMSTMTFVAKDIIYTQGAPPKNCYFLHNGCVQLTVTTHKETKNSNGKVEFLESSRVVREISKMYDPNANFTICNLNEKLDEYTFGITSLLLGERRASTATCVTALTQLSSLSSASLRKLQNKYPDFIIELQTEARKERDQFNNESQVQDGGRDTNAFLAERLNSLTLRQQHFEKKISLLAQILQSNSDKVKDLKLATFTSEDMSDFNQGLML